MSDYKHPQHGNGGHRSAVSLPQNNHQHDLRDVTIARLIVATPHRAYWCQLNVQPIVRQGFQPGLKEDSPLAEYPEEEF